MKIRASILGATGYTGEELLRVLAGHPEVEIISITSESQTDTAIDQVYPHLRQFYHERLQSIKEIEKIASGSDVVFAGLPHGHAMAIGQQVLHCGAKFIDLGADYRFKNTATYEKWYKLQHIDKEAATVYGLPELNRDKIKQAKIIANPGCYTTASILALAPLVKEKLVDNKSLIVDAKSGLSGAGRGQDLKLHFCEAYENFNAYGIANHRHTPEIEETLSEQAGEEIIINFTPHLVPMVRGILATCYGNLKSGVQAEQVDAAFQKAYANEYFMRLLGRNGYPATKNTRGSNFCDLAWHIDPRTNRVIVVSAIDNLVKGAAGQAVQNMNILFGLDEKSGLMQVPLYP